TQFCQQGIISGCLTVKLSAEVCDLSEDMRTAMDKGASGVIALLAQALESGRNEKTLSFSGDPLTQAQVLYSLWLGANLQAKMSRSAVPLESALAHVKNCITAPGVWPAFLFTLLLVDWSTQEPLCPLKSCLPH